MAPAAAASILAATSGAAAASKRPAASDAEQLVVDSSAPPQGDDDAARKSEQPKQQQQLECPRCHSTNTKFCYYNNYSTAQPRHFCRACRRYWTHGGTLRDVPVGGATRRSGTKRRRVSAEPSSSPRPQRVEDNACTADLLSAATAAFPFLSDGSFLLPQFDLGAVAPATAFSSWPSAAVPDFFDGLAPWDDGTGGATSVAGAWGDIAGVELTWPPLGN